MNMNARMLLVACLVAVTACAGKMRMIPGTKVADSQFNRSIIDRIEAYRRALERGDSAELQLMASKNYWEDSGTPSGSDDYGYDGLAAVLGQRFAKATDVRYSMRYVSVRSQCGSEPAEGCRVSVEILMDASFSVIDATGKVRRPDKRDQGEFVLERIGDKWMFVSGM
jgi:hypothetical protein